MRCACASCALAAASAPPNRVAGRRNECSNTTQKPDQNPDTPQKKQNSNNTQQIGPRLRAHRRHPGAAGLGEQCRGGGQPAAGGGGVMWMRVYMEKKRRGSADCACVIWGGGWGAGGSRVEVGGRTRLDEQEEETKTKLEKSYTAFQQTKTRAPCFRFLLFIQVPTTRPQQSYTNTTSNAHTHDSPSSALVCPS